MKQDTHRPPHKPNHRSNRASIAKRIDPKRAKHSGGSRRLARAHRERWTDALHKELAVGSVGRRSRRRTGGQKRKARRLARYAEAAR